ncbi:MAG: four helix bundle protein [Methylobacter sp.]|nr:MAG: four helix bundle protein [Methylobacter sp.]
MSEANQRQLPIAIHDCHQLLAWIIPKLDQFPRTRRFTLGEKLEKLLMEVLEYLLEAAYQKGEVKLQMLARANRKLAVARHLWRLGFELKSCSFNAYNHGAELMVSLGKQIGGWRKAAAHGG